MARKTEEQLIQRAEELQEYENRLHQSGCTNIAGVDEAGRGPLAGAVYAAAVILPPDALIVGLDDSKKLSEKKREQLYDVIIEKALAYSVCAVDERRIDEINILNATYEAMNKAVCGLSIQPDYVLIDGDREGIITYPHETVVKGDGKCACIAAASVLAKVTRDRYITAMAELYPEYGFEKHKGYGTKAHMEAILKYGPCPIHRKSFLKKLLRDGI